MFYQHLSVPTALKMEALKYFFLSGDLSKTFRFDVRAPSAANNRETLKMNLMLIYNMTGQHVQAMIEMGDAAFGLVAPAQLQKMKEQFVSFYPPRVPLHPQGPRRSWPSQGCTGGH